MIRRLILLSLFALAVVFLAGAVARGSGVAAAGKVRLRTFAGHWVGHTRKLLITRRGRGSEQIGDGCCDPVVDLTFELSRPRGTTSNASARLRVTSVQALDPSAYPNGGEPRVGQRGRLRLKNGVITESVTGTNYCDRQAGLRGACGA
jgi:hypothetical protein